MRMSSTTQPASPVELNAAPVFGVEKIPVTVYPSSQLAAAAVAREIADLIRVRASAGAQVVLGLATGSTPTGLYDELIRLHKEEGLSFKNVVTFNLDEYWPMDPNELQSYVRFMREHLFDFVDIDPKNIHIPAGTIAREAVAQFWANYERGIKEAGGLDYQTLASARRGMLAFTSPACPAAAATARFSFIPSTPLAPPPISFANWKVPR